MVLILDIISDGDKRKLGSINLSSIRIDGYRRSRSVRRAQSISTEYKELGSIECFSRSNQWPPPNQSQWSAKLQLYQSSTSALPESAWQIIMTFDPSAFSFPHVLYATGTRLKITPDSSSNSGTITIDWLSTSPENGFSDCESQCSKGNLSALDTPIQETYLISLNLPSSSTFSIRLYIYLTWEKGKFFRKLTTRSPFMVSFHGSSLNFLFSVGSIHVRKKFTHEWFRRENFVESSSRLWWIGR